NGRWAKARGLERSCGHRKGAENVATIVEECRRLGVEYLTLYAFSTENWKRPKTEIKVLFELLKDFLSRELPLLQEQKIRLFVLGDLEGLPLPERLALTKVMQATKDNTAMTLNLAINYGGRNELVRAVQKILRAKLDPLAVDEETLATYLDTVGQPDPDCVIRTSGEMRFSNYLLYQAAYSELIFTPVFWPDFGVDHLHEALAEYARRHRRFGQTEEQVSN
ncbi:MAG: di-trans,poly-cis-decaprenylcistransferase, partial [Desulfovibrio sp.]|nr:di-trans,poly-cis-decaprenylcistransferase [Desulfovibrio sp.]